MYIRKERIEAGVTAYCKPSLQHLLFFSAFDILRYPETSIRNANIRKPVFALALLDLGERVRPGETHQKGHGQIRQ